jgi:hypothetical protein
MAIIHLLVSTTINVTTIDVVVEMTTTMMSDVAMTHSQRTAEMSVTYLHHRQRSTPMTPFSTPRGRST